MRLFCIFILLILCQSASATVSTIPILNGAGHSFNSAWGSDGLGNFFSLGGIYGINGDNQADVFSDLGLGAHITNFGALPLPPNAAQETGGNLGIAAGGLAPSSAAWGGSGTMTTLTSGLQAIYLALQLGTKTAGSANSANSVQTEPNTGGENDSGNSTNSSAPVTVLAASGVSGVREYMTALQLGRSDNATTPITVSCTDGTTTRMWVLSNNGNGGVNNMTWPLPGLKWIVNHIVTCTPSAGVATFFASGAGYNAP